MGKTFVLDTSVLLHDPQAIFKFTDSDVHIPLTVLEELDRFKKSQTENGRNARYLSRIVDELRAKGSLAKGVSLDNGGKLIINHDKQYLDKSPELTDFSINDNLILARAISLQKDGKKVVLVSKDINLRVKADACGVDSEDFGTRKGSIEELYPGQRVLPISRKKLEHFEKERFLAIAPNEFNEIIANEYFVLEQKDNSHHRLLARYCGQKKGMVPLINVREGVWGIYPKNIEQQFALDSLLNNELKLVTLVGKAGTGKTLMAIAAGLEMAIGKNEYHRVLVSRPVMPMGRDLGFLPGDVNEKLGPWMQPIFDNIDYLFGVNHASAKNAGSWEDLINKGLLHVEPLTYIRGRSIPSQFLIVDEAQNLTPHEIKTIITRAGENTKIVLTGDCEQIDNPYLDSLNNGLAYVIERLKEEEIVAHTTLKIGERSQLSEVASKYL